MQLGCELGRMAAARKMYGAKRLRPVSTSTQESCSGTSMVCRFTTAEGVLATPGATSFNLPSGTKRRLPCSCCSGCMNSSQEVDAREQNSDERYVCDLFHQSASSIMISSAYGCS